VAGEAWEGAQYPRPEGEEVSDFQRQPEVYRRPQC